VECPCEREKLRRAHGAGCQARKNEKAGDTPLACPFLHRNSLRDHARTEFGVMLGHVQHLGEVLHKHSGGNPAMQAMSDVVTLADHLPCLSVGHNVTCPRTYLPMNINTGFEQVADVIKQIISSLPRAKICAFSVRVKPTCHTASALTPRRWA
jgi:hypothetical protein